MSTLTKPRHTGGRKPRVTIGAGSLEHLEGLSDGAMASQPKLADLLLEELGRAKIVPDTNLPDDVVAMHRPVTYRDESTGRDKTVTLVYPEEADIARGHVSVLTPIRIALLGLAEKATFPWETRDGTKRMLSVVSVARVDETRASP
ncbi:MAG: nucleoside diphosphate kinase regulator [Pseudomonadota bacterium]|nr:nucleoside diphosphate kinase regulator [Pseudomonadota bacterium]